MSNIKWDNIKMIDTYGANHLLPAMSIIAVIVPNSTVKDISKYLDNMYGKANTFVWYKSTVGFSRTKITMVGVNKDIYAMFEEISWDVHNDSTKDLVA